MPIVQFYRSQVELGGELMPVVPNGGTLNWPKNHAAPAIVGNFWQLNYIEGLQMPTCDLQLALLDGSAPKCPINTTLLAMFLTRSNDYQHDVLSGVGMPLKFFDGRSGFNFATVKPGSFTVGGSKGDDVRCSMSFAAYGTIPSVTLTPPDGTYPYFAGAPIRFQSCSFLKNGSPFSGVYSWDISFNNNLTPDLSMVGTGPQSVFPVDCNAGMQTVAARIVMQALEGAPPISDGDEISINISQGAINTTFTLKNVVVQTGNDRNIGASRQLRSYVLLCLGDSNTVPPLVVS